MNKTFSLLAVAILAVGLMGSAYAHKAHVIGDYKIEVGWKNEPPTVGKKNAIELVVTKATLSDKKASTNHDSHDNNDKKTTKTTKTSHDESSTNIKLVSTSKDNSEHKHDTKTTKSKSTKKSIGVSGLSKTLELDVTLNGKKTFLNLVEDKQHKGIYYGNYIPDSVGYPTVHVVGKIKNIPVEITFHPEKVEAAK
ncbi:MAG: hypothetical protein ACT4OD_05385 [Candidatus Nitrosotenuis sp.]